MNRTIDVHLGEEARQIGRLRYDEQGARESAAFEYDAAWLASDDSFAIEPGLPLVAGSQFHRKTREGSIFHLAIADTAPDGWGKRVIQRDHAKNRQEARRAGEVVETKFLNSLDFLLAVDDVSRVGALRLRDEKGIFRRASEEGRRGIPPIIELSLLLSATRAVETNRETAADLAYLRGRGTSLGGLRPKCTVLDHEGRLAIGKFPSVNDEHPVTKGEVLALRLARLAGIDAAEARLIDTEGGAVALIRRFDRPEGGGRLMYISAATMLGADPGDTGEHAYTELVDALRRYGSKTLIDTEELWRRIAFSILITNVDDHLMNHGFLHVDRGQWRLAPAFDVNPFPDRLRELKTWVSEDTGPEATIDALMSATTYFRISAPRAKSLLARIEAAVAQWRTVGGELGMDARELDSFAAAFEHDERAVARRLSTLSTGARDQHSDRDARIAKTRPPPALAVSNRIPKQLSFAGFDAAPRPADRLFFAIFPDADAAARIAGLARGLRDEYGLTSPALAPNRLHITLHHLGDYMGLPSDIVAAARSAAEAVVMPPFEIALDRVVSFLGRRGARPFVLLGDEGVADLNVFQRALGASMTRAGLGRWAKPRFTPHVTMLYDGRGVEEQVVKAVGWTAREFVLVHSELGQTRHVLLGRWPLRG